MALVAVSFAGGAVTSQVAGASTEEESPYVPFDQLARVMVIVENQYVEPARREKMVEGAIKGMVSELDPHSAFMTAEDYALFQSDTEGQFGGVGVEVDFRDDYVTVVAPIEGSPAERAGIKSGDQIIAVDGRPTRGVRVDKLVRIMRGTPGSKVHITVARKGVDEPLTFDLVREIIQIQSVFGKRLTGNVAYLRIKQFQDGTHEELLRAIGDIRKAGDADLSGVVLDLRNNPGGLVDEAEAVADEFLGRGVIYSTRHRAKIVDEVRARAGGALADIPMVALINQYSASSSELVAGALKDGRRALLVGNRTFGKGSVQTIYDLPNGAGLRLTTMRYYTPSGRSIQAAGVLPHVVIEHEDQAAEAEVVRESDLEGHLAAERPAQEKPDETVTGAPAVDEKTIARSAKDMPVDPRKGRDFDLKYAYGRLQEKIAAER